MATGGASLPAMVMAIIDVVKSKRKHKGKWFPSEAWVSLINSSMGNQELTTKKLNKVLKDWNNDSFTKTECDDIIIAKENCKVVINAETNSKTNRCFFAVGDKSVPAPKLPKKEIEKCELLSKTHDKQLTHEQLTAAVFPSRPMTAMEETPASHSRKRKRAVDTLSSSRQTFNPIAKTNRAPTETDTPANRRRLDNRFEAAAGSSLNNSQGRDSQQANLNFRPIAPVTTPEDQAWNDPLSQKLVDVCKAHNLKPDDGFTGEGPNGEDAIEYLAKHGGISKLVLELEKNKVVDEYKFKDDAAFGGK